MTYVHISKAQRALLLNQYRILEILDTKNAEQYRNFQKILERGFTILYSDIIRVCDEMTVEEGRYVLDVLDVFRTLKSSYEQLADKSGINPERLKFEGFGGNGESQLTRFTEFLKEHAQYKETVPDSINSHSPTEYRYRPMVERYHAIERRHKGLVNGGLNKEEILEILE